MEEGRTTAASKHLVLLFLICVFGCLQPFAQSDADLFLYSKHYHGGSARFESMGGAFGSLGADISAVQINPAGIGRLSSSQVMLSLAPTINQTSADFMGTKSKNNKFSFSIPSFGVVFTNDLSMKNQGDVYSQFAIGMNRLAHYHQSTTISGNQYPSLIENFMGQAQGFQPSELSTYFPFTTSLAWESYVINFDPSTNQYTSYLTEDDMVMNRKITTKGGSNEFFFAFARNRMNKLYYGASLNIRTYKHEMNYIHTEDLKQESPYFQGFDYQYTIKTTGTGVNLKLGAIYLVNNQFRIGAALHTPTYVVMEDEWTADMTGRFKDSAMTIPKDLVPTGHYKYNMLTPLKAVVSASYVFGMKAVLSADIEYVGYNMSRLLSTKDITYEPYNFKSENANAKARLTSAINYRLGFEYNIQQKLFLRAGFSMYGSAYKKSENVDSQADISFSGGLGYKNGRYSIDLAYVNRSIERTYYPFAGSNTATTSLSNNQVIVSGAISF